MFSVSSNVRKIIGTCFLVALFLSFASAYLHIRGMSGMGNMDMPMPGCPFMNDSAVLCNMDPIQHITAWQHMFTAIPVMGTMLILLLVIVLTLTRTDLMSWFCKIPELELSYSKTILPSERYVSPNYLQEIFSQGILNPKLF